MRSTAIQKEDSLAPPQSAPVKTPPLSGNHPSTFAPPQSAPVKTTPTATSSHPQRPSETKRRENASSRETRTKHDEDDVDKSCAPTIRSERVVSNHVSRKRRSKRILPSRGERGFGGKSRKQPRTTHRSIYRRIRIKVRRRTSGRIVTLARSCIFFLCVCVNIYTYLSIRAYVHHARLRNARILSPVLPKRRRRLFEPRILR